MERIDCRAYVNEKVCNALIEKECNGCKFYKTKEEFDLGTKNAMNICIIKGIKKYNPYFKRFLNGKDDEYERE